VLVACYFSFLVSLPSNDSLDLQVPGVEDDGVFATL